MAARIPGGDRQAAAYTGQLLAMAPPFAKNAKWLADVHRATPVSDAARVALGARLASVEHYLDRAVRRPRADVEDVHQLRVATRRSVAAVELFAPLIPPRRHRWLVKQLKRIRQAGGEARDWDVFLDRLPLLVGEDEPELARALKRTARQERRRAQRPLAASARRWQRKEAPRRVRRLLKRLRYSTDGADSRDFETSAAEPTFAAFAGEAMAQVFEQFHGLPLDERSPIDELHQFRIVAKQLRYAMEIFAAAFGPAFREELYPLVETLQERLGQINDHAGAIARLEAWPDDFGPGPLAEGLARVIDREREALGAARVTFHAWWTPAERERFAAAFRRFLGGPPVAGRVPSEAVG